MYLFYASGPTVHAISYSMCLHLVHDEINFADNVSGDADFEMSYSFCSY